MDAISSSYNFKFKKSDFIDVCIISGLEFKNKQILLESNPLDHLTQEGASQALKELDLAYDQYTQNIKNNLTYDDFVSKVELIRPQLKDAEPEYKEAIANRLSELTIDNTDPRESYNAVHLFFHMFWQLLQGHGIRTYQEWGLHLAEELKKETFEWITDVNKMIYSEFSLFNNQYSDKINRLSDNDFLKFLNDVMFRADEPYRFNNKNKFDVFSSLNDKKKSLFYDTLLARSDWAAQVCDINQCLSPDKNFVTPKLLEKFQSNPDEIFKQNVKEMHVIFIALITEWAIKDYIAKGNNLAIVDLIEKSKSITHFHKFMINNPSILTKEDIIYLKTSFKTFQEIPSGF